MYGAARDGTGKYLNKLHLIAQHTPDRDCSSSPIAHCTGGQTHCSIMRLGCYRSSSGASSVSMRGPLRRESRSPFGPGDTPFCRSLRSSPLLCSSRSCASPLAAADSPSPFSASATSLRAWQHQPDLVQAMTPCNTAGRRLLLSGAAQAPPALWARQPGFTRPSSPKGMRHLRGERGVPEMKRGGGGLVRGCMQGSSLLY